VAGDALAARAEQLLLAELERRTNTSSSVACLVAQHQRAGVGESTR
jgi:hypothetical protein